MTVAVEARSRASEQLFDNVGGAPVVPVGTAVVLSVEEATAALVYFFLEDQAELLAADVVRREVEFLALYHGLGAVRRAARALPGHADREWVNFCRRRVAEVFGLPAGAMNAR